jgi:predicted regulator of Ras-like GTPase activity (Roadblock/LC7/MglB family)
MSKLDMNKILDESVSFDGISHGCIYKDEQIMASTFPSIIQDKLIGMGRFIDKIFTTSRAIDRAHDEVHIELEENTLIAYRVNDEFLLMLMAAKGINLSLVYMTIKSIEKSVKLHGIAPSRNKPSQPSAANVVGEKKAVQDHNKEDIPVWLLGSELQDDSAELTHEQTVESYLKGLKKILLDSFGPVGDIIFEEAVKEWRVSHQPTLDNLGKLVDLITLEIDGKGEKRSFFVKATRYIRTSIGDRK